MNGKTVIPFIVALGLGVGAIIVGRQVLTEKKPPAPEQAAQAETVRVVVAKRDLTVGRKLEAADLGTVDLPLGAVPESALRDPAALVDRIVAHPVARGQTLVASAVAAREAGVGLQALVPIGMRAATIEVDEYHGMTRQLIPGCRVDVLVTVVDEERRRSITRTVLENVQVQLVGQQMEPRPRGDGPATAPTRSVTLLVSPQQAEVLELATSKGRPRLVMRSGQDNEPSNVRGLTVTELVGRPAAWMEAVAQDEPEQPNGGRFAAFMAAMAASAAQQQPVAVAAEEHVESAPPRPQPMRRTVQMIRNGAESTRHFDVLEDGSSTASAQ